MANNIVSFGLKNVVYSMIYFQNDQIVFGPPKPLKGAQELSLDLLGGSSHVYADDYTVGTFNAYVGKTIALKLTEVYWDFKFEALGYVADPNNNWSEAANAQPQPFALGFEIDGDKHKRRVWMYFCLCQPYSFGTKTKTDTVEANSITLNINCYSVKKNENQEILKIVANEGDDNYDTFLSTPPSLNFTRTFVYRYCPADNENTDGFFTITGSPSDVSNHSYNGRSYNKGLKLTSSNMIQFELGNYDNVKLEMIGYANQSNEMPTPTLNITYSSQPRSTQVTTWSLKDVEEMTKKTVTALYPNTRVNLKKGTEIMLCEVVLTVTITE